MNLTFSGNESKWPELKSSKTVTSQPLSIKRATAVAPIYPAPPVTKTLKD